MTFRVHVRVMPRTGLLDPQGQAVEHALSALGFAEAGPCGSVAPSSSTSKPVRATRPKRGPD